MAKIKVACFFLGHGVYMKSSSMFPYSQGQPPR